jgi:hypothetical protein
MSVYLLIISDIQMRRMYFIYFAYDMYMTNVYRLLIQYYYEIYHVYKTLYRHMRRY